MNFGSKIKLAVLAVALVALVGGAYLAYSHLAMDTSAPSALGTPSPSASADVPKHTDAPPPDDLVKAPDFTVYTEAGEEVRLSDLRGKPVIVNFWATWCGYCVLEMPLFQEVFEERGDEIEFMLIDCNDNASETVEAGAEYIAGEGYTFPVYYDTSQEAQYLYSIRSLPTTLFIDAEGNIVGSHIGMLTEELFEIGLGLFEA